mgnify:FL=1
MPTHAFSVKVDGQTISGSGSFTVLPAQTTGLKNIGMSSPANLWDQRLSEVGANGIKSRRIYADVSASGISNRALIEDAIAAGMTPVVSFKLPSFAPTSWTATNTWVTTAANQLQAYGVPILIACWHEPYDDMTGPQWLAMQRQVLPILNAKANLSTYCILHGWLLDNRIQDWNSFMAPDVMAMLTYFGCDSYQSGTNTAPGDKDLSTRMPTLLSWLNAQGVPNKPVVIGEFSAYTAASLTSIGETILSTPQVKYALEFNSNTGGKGEPLVPGTTRMTAFKNIKADPRAMQ